ncbi:MAG TPA: DUF1707 domain-containing protein [Gemmatimonadaceae bacterium]|nr:DUF1707 domain-containing protein [Gemmatimonadaceae bacterium]
MPDFDTPRSLPIASGTDSPLHDARERAVRLLTDGFAYDIITVEEFEWRLGQMSRAESPQEIDALVADLATPPAASSPSLYSGVPMPAPTEGRILGIMSETRRTGPWRVPQRLRVKGIMSEVKIDLRYAVVPPGCAIDVSAIMANVQFIVPPGMIVDFDVGAVMASARNDPRAAGLDVYTVPHIRIRGSAVMAEVRVKVRDVGR